MAIMVRADTATKLSREQSDALKARAGTVVLGIPARVVKDGVTYLVYDDRRLPTQDASKKAWADVTDEKGVVVRVEPVARVAVTEPVIGEVSR